MSQIILEAKVRKPTKPVNNQFKKDGYVPATLYKKGSSQSIAILAKSLPKSHSHTKLLQLDLEGKKTHAVMREVQVNPLTEQPLHIDLQEVGEKDSVKMHVPVKFGSLSKEQEKDCMLNILERYLLVETTAGTFPEAFEINVAALKLGESVRADQIPLPAGCKLKARPHMPIVSLIKQA